MCIRDSVYDPLRDEMFTASRGEGAQLNGKRLRVSSTRQLTPALLGTGFPFRDLSIIEPWMRSFQSLVPKTAGIRRAGAAALDLAYVAAGRLDGFWEFGLKPLSLIHISEPTRPLYISYAVFCLKKKKAKKKKKNKKKIYLYFFF